MDIGKLIVFVFVAGVIIAALVVYLRNHQGTFKRPEIKDDKNGSPFMRGICSDVTVPSGESEVAFNGRAQLDGVSIFSVFGSALMTDLSAYTADVFFTAVDPDGTATPVARKGVQVGNYLKK